MVAQSIVVLIVGVLSFALGARYGKAAYEKAVAEAKQIQDEVKKHL